MIIRITQGSQKKGLKNPNFITIRKVVLENFKISIIFINILFLKKKTMKKIYILENNIVKRTTAILKTDEKIQKS